MNEDNELYFMGIIDLTTLNFDVFQTAPFFFSVKFCDPLFLLAITTKLQIRIIFCDCVGMFYFCQFSVSVDFLSLILIISYLNLLHQCISGKMFQIKISDNSLLRFVKKRKICWIFLIWRTYPKLLLQKNIGNLGLR